MSETWCAVALIGFVLLAIAGALIEPGSTPPASVFFIVIGWATTYVIAPLAALVKASSS